VVLASLALLPVLVPTQAPAVVQAWTALIEGPSGGDLVGTAQVAGVTYSLLQGYGGPDGPIIGRIARVDEAGYVSWVREIVRGESLSFGGIAGDGSGLYVAINSESGLGEHVPAGETDVFVRKLSFEAAELWTRAFATAAGEAAYSIAANDGVVAVGGEISEDPPITPVDGFVRTYDADGTLLWKRVTDLDRTDHITAVAVEGSGVYVAISHAITRSASFRRYAPDGTRDWTTSVASDARLLLSGIAVAQDRVFVTGSAEGSLRGTTPLGGWDMFVIALRSPTGELRWTRRFGSDANDFSYDLAVGPEGVYAGGVTYGALPRFHNIGGADAVVRSYEFGGHRRWTRQFGTRRIDTVFAVTADAGGVISAGFTDGNLGPDPVTYASYYRRWAPA
jgi:outer membrane protein assembly factor BamB